ncbi:MAG: tetratricopeptide repeat protein [Lachnospiraceae bacterium]|nr:tetratricopeptide repeat protein [Lachnospiraceae bacterium]
MENRELMFDMKQNVFRQKKRSISKTGILILSAVAVTVTAAILFVYFFSNSPSKNIKNQLDLWKKYLTELDYEQAVAAFKEALSIDSRSEEAKEYLESAYVEWVNMLLKDGKTEEAKRILEEAHTILPDSKELTDSTDLIVRNEEISDFDENPGNQSITSVDDADGTENDISLIHVDLDVDSYRINGIPLKELDFTKMLNSLGGSESPLVLYHPIGNPEDTAIGAFSESQESLILYNDGYYHTPYPNSEDIMEPEFKFLTVYNGVGYDTTCEYWYTCSAKRARFMINTYYQNSPSSESIKEIESFCVLPFIYGNYEDMNRVFHTDEIMSNGKAEDIGNGYKSYVTKTDKGKYISLSTNGSSMYQYNLDNLIVNISYTDGIEMSAEVTYSWDPASS